MEGRWQPMTLSEMCSSLPLERADAGPNLRVMEEERMDSMIDESNRIRNDWKCGWTQPDWEILNFSAAASSTSACVPS